MKKEDILERSRQENRGNDEREKAAGARAGQLASAVGGLMCMVIILLETLFRDGFGTVTEAAWAIYLSMTGTVLLVKYLKLRKRHELIFGMLELALAGAFAVMMAVGLAGGKG